MMTSPWQIYCNISSVQSLVTKNNENKKFNNIEAEYDKPLEEINITLEDINKAIKAIKPHSSACDDMPAILLKQCGTTINYPLLLIWKQSLDSGYVYPQFKQQTIAPIHKKDPEQFLKITGPYVPPPITSSFVRESSKTTF